ncbi:hypothetical protein DY000_02002632 [Brassica cretica]|uniref:Uncharacterized protein n=1 Tax=Brassica cretica TaxID=69181 RepID=A0ABQ7BRI2_BRACR|nr:hypothetical protein DY000_02002632 [Brassica cretica]
MCLAMKLRQWVSPTGYHLSPYGALSQSVDRVPPCRSTIPVTVTLVITDCRRYPSSRHPIRTIRECRSLRIVLRDLNPRSDTICNGPIPRRPTGFIERALWTRVYSFSQPYVSRYCPAHREMEREGMSNGLLSEVTLDQLACMTLYTTLCGNQGWLATTIKPNAF